MSGYSVSHTHFHTLSVFHAAGQRLLLGSGGCAAGRRRLLKTLVGAAVARLGDGCWAGYQELESGGWAAEQCLLESGSH